MLDLPIRRVPVPLGLYVIGALVFFRWQWRSAFDLTIGDRGDARLVGILHDHIYRWALSFEVPFLSPPFFLQSDEDARIHRCVSSGPGLLCAVPVTRRGAAARSVPGDRCIVGRRLSVLLYDVSSAQRIGWNRRACRADFCIPKQPVPGIASPAALRCLLSDRRRLLRGRGGGRSARQATPRLCARYHRRRIVRTYVLDWLLHGLVFQSLAPHFCTSRRPADL